MIDLFSRAVLQAQAKEEGAALPAWKAAQAIGSAAVLDAILNAGLSGKGGANFPTHRKLALMIEQPGPEKHLVVNGGEHEPGSSKDQFLLERYPDTVIEGALIIADLVRATSIRIAVKEGAEQAISAMHGAINRAKQLLGGAAPVIVLDPIPDSYLVGEESALIASLDGERAVPRQRPPFPIVSGLRSQPTLVHNVETVAHVPFIVLAGADRYRCLGEGTAGVTLCTFGPEFANPGVRLVSLGISLREVVTQYGGGLRSGAAFKAVQPGGPGTGILSEAELDVRFDDASLKQAGSALGCGAIRALSTEDDIVPFIVDIANFFSANSCGQCPPCRMETQMLARILVQVASGKGSAKLLDQIPVVIENAAKKPAFCFLVKMPVPPITSALAKFSGEFAAYLAPASEVRQSSLPA
ncbi:MAG TPA: NADH-ubiquinone oxidoreductase-F iron-sulfur binding region domain-containing protein [Terriglobales bacterium]|nr:NADH-ubiquinone oxidoreductase-F iron-sulfur binding region domain-containing protein [Terriglobales bacterium]